MEIKKKVTIILTPIVANLLRFLIYFFLLFLIVSFVKKESYIVLLSDFCYEIMHDRMPDIFRTVIVCSLMFLVFTTVVSAIIATRDQNYLKTSLVIRFLLFIMNVMPISLFQHFLLPKFGFRIIYFVLIYFLVHIVVDVLKPILSTTIQKINIPVWLGKFIHESLVIIISMIVIYLLPFSNSADMRNLNMEDFSDLFVFLIYIVLFNAVTFFTVEYCVNVFREEYKKNYTKYYFLYTRHIFQRIKRILKNVMPQVLEKIRKNLSWLVMFIIAVESIFQNKESVGFSLLRGYINPNGAIIMIQGIFYLLLVMFLINSLCDIFLGFLVKYDKIENKNITEHKIHHIEKRKFNRKAIAVILSIFIFVVCYILLFTVNQKEYAFVGYYDFGENQNRTVDALLYQYGIDETRCDPDLLMEYRDTYLCVQDENDSYFSIIQLGIEDKNGELVHLIPYYDKRDTQYYFIQENKNVRAIFDIQPTDRIGSIERIEKYRDFTSSALITSMTSFSLVTDKDSVTNISKPLYLVLPYYLFYFLTIFLVVIVLVCIIYLSITRYFFVGRRRMEIGVDNKIYVIEKNGIFRNVFNEIVHFINTTNIIVIFMLVNLFLNMLQESKNLLAWENQLFSTTVLSYCLIQMLIIIMFSDSFINEIIIYVKNFKETKEFYYYSLIGMSQEQQYIIFNKKYGYKLLSKLIVQNILFVLNINWFIVYAFSTWRRFNDSIGVTYAISFENIFTKIIRYESISIDISNIIILIGMNAILFGLYYLFQKRLTKG
jgi:hypothetical protein